MKYSSMMKKMENFIIVIQAFVQLKWLMVNINELILVIEMGGDMLII